MDRLQSRRQFVQGARVASLGLLAGCGIGALQAPPPAPIPRVSFLSPDHPSHPSAESDRAFQEGLRELGYVEGQNVIVEWRYLEDKPEHAADLAADVVRLPVDVIVTRGRPLTQAVSRATSTIPIVVPTLQDPVGTGLVQSLARPGGNVTGLSIVGPHLSAKRLELLKETVPTVARVGVFWDPSEPANMLAWEETVVAAQSLGLQLQSLAVRHTEEFERVVEMAAREMPDVLIVSTGILLNSTLATRLREFAALHARPAMYVNGMHARAGGLMAYGPNTAEAHRRAAYYVDKILKGAKPADLPVEQPRQFEFVINLKTARDLGLTIPQHVLVQATEIIQ